MAGITDLTFNEVRIRQGAEFTQVPNFIVAGEELADGQFVYLSSMEGQFLKASQDERATHLVLDSGQNRITVDDIADKTGKVLEGEPTRAITGLGTVQIPLESDVVNGQALSVNKNGYAVAWSKDSGSAGAFIVGTALEDMIADPYTGFAWGDCFINLPAQHSPEPKSEGDNK